MIQDQSKDLTLIVYDTPKPPKYLKLNKKLINYLFIIIPILVISSISISFLYSMYLKKKVNELRSKEPQLILDLKTEIDDLKTNIKSLKKNNSILTQKLSQGSSQESNLATFNLFNIPPGLEDLRNQELLRIENYEVSSTQNEIIFKFNLANNSPSKLSGYITVVQYQGELTQFYPQYELSEKHLRFEFAKGESFGFSRFRPTIAKFKKYSNSSVKYKIYIFTRTGNLIEFKQTGPYNIE